MAELYEFFKRVLKLAWPYRFRLFVGVTCGFLAGLCSPLLMASVKLATEAAFPGSEPGSGAAKIAQMPQVIQHALNTVQGWSSVSDKTIGQILLIALIPFSMLLRGVFIYLNLYLTNWVAVRAVASLRQKLFKHLMDMSVGYFSKVSTGALMSHMNAASTVQSTISNSLVTLIREPVTIISLLVFLFWQQPKLALGSMLILPLTLIPFVFYANKARKSARAWHGVYAQQGRHLHESITGHRIIKAYNLEDKAVNDFVESTNTYIGLHMRLVRAMELPGPIMEFAGALAVACFLCYATLAGGRDQLTGGDVLQFIGSIFLMYQPIKAILRMRHDTEKARAATEVLFQALETKSDIGEPSNPKPLRAGDSDIRVENVTFRYDEKIVLDRVTFTAKANQLTALVGPSGSGKTTLTNLVLRFYDPQEGRIVIGDTDIKDVASRDLRDQIAIVTQETILFNDTIRNNILVGRAGATDAEIEAAARAAMAHDFIMAKPDGYNTLVGERGVMLSGGQRQRIAIARALLKNAPVLVLDEATSSLDTESERAIQIALDKLMEGRTTICIAHRLSTILHADLIVCFDAGRIVEMGNHEQLLGKQGLYSRLYNLQFNS